MSNSRHLSFVEMEAARQRALVRATAARKMKEEKRENGKERASSSTPKAIRKGVPKKRLTGRTTVLLRSFQSHPGISSRRSCCLPS